MKRSGSDADTIPPDGAITMEEEEVEDSGSGGGDANNARKIRSPISFFISLSLFVPTSVRVVSLELGLDSGQGLGEPGAPIPSPASPIAVGKSLMTVRSRGISR